MSVALCLVKGLRFIPADGRVAVGVHLLEHLFYAHRHFLDRNSAGFIAIQLLEPGSDPRRHLIERNLAVLVAVEAFKHIALMQAFALLTLDSRKSLNRDSQRSNQRAYDQFALHTQVTSSD